jgi:glycosyltransferase involved in cell wall biosynthesis
MPKVSIIIPTYNREEYIVDAIESLLSQTFRDFEIIVIDDGSTDNTKQVLSKYGDKIRYIYQVNSERAVARNKGIEASKGEYIAFLDSDDLCMSNRLVEQVNVLDSKPDVGLVYANAIYVDYAKNIVIDKTAYIQRPSGFIFRYIVLAKDIFSPSQVLVRRSCFNKVGYFDHSTIPAEDWDMWLRIAKVYKVEHIPRPLVKYRLHSRESIGRQAESTLKAKLKVSQKHLSRELIPVLLDNSKELYLIREKAIDNIINEAVDGVYQLYVSGNMIQTRKVIGLMISAKPFLITDKLVMSVFFKSFLGQSLVNWLRLMKHAR